MKVPELSRATIVAWRQFLNTEAANTGILHLMCHAAPKVRGRTPTELVECGLKWAGYQEALNDLTDVLTLIPAKEKPIEGPGLEEAERSKDED